MMPMPPTSRRDARDRAQEDGEHAGDLPEDRHEVALVDHREVVFVLELDVVTVAQQICDLDPLARVHALFADHLGVDHRHQRLAAAVAEAREQPLVSRGHRHQHHLILVAATCRRRPSLQHADHVERDVVDLDRRVDGIRALFEETLGHAAAQDGHARAAGHILLGDEAAHRPPGSCARFDIGRDAGDLHAHRVLAIADAGRGPSLRAPPDHVGHIQRIGDGLERRAQGQLAKLRMPGDAASRCPSSCPARRRAGWCRRSGADRVTSFCTPWPTDSRVITAPTPMMMPNIVSAERSLFTARARRRNAGICSTRFMSSLLAIPRYADALP